MKSKTPSSILELPLETTSSQESAILVRFFPEKIADVLRLKGFDVVEQFDIRRFTIFTVARKGAGCG